MYKKGWTRRKAEHRQKDDKREGREGGMREGIDERESESAKKDDPGKTEVYLLEYAKEYVGVERPLVGLVHDDGTVIR
jgi:hypothetical protein